jgi:hypothetical protein
VAVREVIAHVLAGEPGGKFATGIYTSGDVVRCQELPLADIKKVKK